MSEGPAEPVKAQEVKVQNAKRPGAQAQGKARRTPWLFGLATVVVAAVLYVIVAHGFKPADGNLKDLATGAMAKLQVPDAPRGEPDASFSGPSSQILHLADFKGQVLVVNFWATWCAPCVQEMPTLAKLQSAFAGQPVRVMAISLDRSEDTAFAQRFILKHAPLAFYQDPKYALLFSLDPRPAGVPVTVIFDRNGHERARLEGAADWSSPQAKAVLNSVLQIRS
jgi:thiol-disulfide isomerase/thioredoxin